MNGSLARLAAAVLCALTTAVAAAEPGSSFHLSHGAGGARLRGQLHLHTTASDGNRDAAEVVRLYREAGYAFVGISDHNRRTPDPLVQGILCIPSSELSDRAADRSPLAGHHLTILGLATDPRDDGWDRDSLEAILRRARAEGALAFANHPRVAHPWPLEDLVGADGLAGLEVFNNREYQLLEDARAGAGMAYFRRQPAWQRALKAGRRLWGTATDDVHDYGDPRQWDRGWVEVHAGERSAEAILAALRSGDFYACRGVDGDAPRLDLAMEAARLAARADRPCRFRLVGPGGLLEELGPAEDASFGLDPEQSFVRVECEDAGDPSRITYSQPLWRGTE
ncbi:MAG: hypothetical protein HY722_06355 [Planctomycetes bacterium]|nr:hypothetical protein [Planctomycetota bacterium]